MHLLSRARGARTRATAANPLAGVLFSSEPSVSRYEGSDAANNDLFPFLAGKELFAECKAVVQRAANLEKVARGHLNADEELTPRLQKRKKNQTLNPLSITLNPLQDDPKKTQNPDTYGSFEGWGAGHIPVLPRLSRLEHRERVR